MTAQGKRSDAVRNIICPANGDGSPGLPPACAQSCKQPQRRLGSAVRPHRVLADLRGKMPYSYVQRARHQGVVYPQSWAYPRSPYVDPLLPSPSFGEPETPMLVHGGSGTQGGMHPGTTSVLTNRCGYDHNLRRNRVPCRHPYSRPHPCRGPSTLASVPCLRLGPAVASCGPPFET